MTGRKGVSGRPSPEDDRAEIRSDLARVDASEPTAGDYADIPELDDAWFDGADRRVGDRLVRRGRPPLDAPKKQVTIRLDQDVLARLRATGPGWQGRVNQALRDWLARRA